MFKLNHIHVAMWIYKLCTCIMGMCRTNVKAFKLGVASSKWIYASTIEDSLELGSIKICITEIWLWMSLIENSYISMNEKCKNSCDIKRSSQYKTSDVDGFSS